jgi:hypothetical protein
MRKARRRSQDPTDGHLSRLRLDLAIDVISIETGAMAEASREAAAVVVILHNLSGQTLRVDASAKAPCRSKANTLQRPARIYRQRPSLA